jgi:hypothetical protein
MNKDELECPHCKYLVEDWYELVDYNQTSDFNDYENVDCPACEKEFSVRQRALLDFQAKKCN